MVATLTSEAEPFELVPKLTPLSSGVLSCLEREGCSVQRNRARTKTRQSDLTCAAFNLIVASGRSPAAPQHFLPSPRCYCILRP